MIAQRIETRIGAALIGLVVVIATQGFGFAQARTEGLDVIVLVDVSGSMYDQLPGRTGNDPERLRWDAVKMVLDLMTEDDRLSILPFNGVCPARDEPNNHRVPAFDAMELSSVTAARRASLGPQIETFIHNLNAPHTDAGGTGIFAALGRAVTDFRAAGGGARTKVVLLLTDGKQESHIPNNRDDSLVATGKEDAADALWRSDSRIAYLQETGARVYAFGLGAGADMKFLKALAATTRGYAFQLSGNQQIVEQFRLLIWSLRDCWTRKMEFVSDGQSKITRSGALAGALDLGALVYELPTERTGNVVREALAPNPKPRLTWMHLAEAPREAMRTGKVLNGRPTGYAYYYFDGRARDVDELGNLFKTAQGAELALAVGPQQKVQGYFVKRMPFRLVAQLDSRTFFRNEPLPLRVTVEPIGQFPPEVAKRYHVEAQLARRDGLANNGSSVITKLVYSSDENAFLAPKEFTALELLDVDKACDLEDQYRLLIRIVEQSQGEVAEWETTLPPIQVTINNTIPLREAPQNLEVTRRTPVIAVPVETVWPLPKRQLGLNVAIKMPRRVGAEKPIAENSLDFSYGGKPLAKQVLLAAGGQLAVEIRLPDDERRIPEDGPFEEVGALTFSPTFSQGLRICTFKPNGAIGPDNEHVAPIRLRLGTIGVRLEATQPSPGVGPKRPQSQQEWTVVTKDDESPSESVLPGSLTLELIPANDTQLTFDKRELWLHPATEPDRRERTINVKKSGEKMVVQFAPRPAMHQDQSQLVGEHHYLLKASGKGFETAVRDVLLHVERPNVHGVLESPTVAHVAPGKVARFSYRLNLEWLPGGRLPVSLATGKVEIRDAEARNSSVMDQYAIDARTIPESPWTLVSPMNATEPGQPTLVRLELPIPPEARRGRYAGGIDLLFRDASVGDLQFEIQLDGLKSWTRVIRDDVQQAFREVGVAESILVPKEGDSIELTRFFDRPDVHTFELLPREGKLKLDPKKLQCRLVSEPSNRRLSVLENEADAQDYVAAPNVRVRGAAPDKLGVLVDLEFPAVANATPGAKYSGRLRCQYRDDQAVDLGEVVLDLSVRHVEAASLLDVLPKPGPN